MEEGLGYVSTCLTFHRAFQHDAAFLGPMLCPVSCALCPSLCPVCCVLRAMYCVHGHNDGKKAPRCRACLASADEVSR